MILYQYKAVGKGGLLVKGTLEGCSQSEAYSLLNERGLSPISLSPLRKYFRFLSFERPLSPRLLRELCLHLSQCEQAGIPLMESIDVLASFQESQRFKHILLVVLKDLEGGKLLSQALMNHPKVFDPVFRGMIRVDEKTGTLTSSFEQLSQHLKWVETVQAEVMRGLRYPLIMLILLGAMSYTLLTIVVPELILFIEDGSLELPLPTQILMTLSALLSNYCASVLTLILCGILLIHVLFKLHPQGSIWKVQLQGRLPVFGPLQKQIALARFCHLFALMVERGIDILQAIQIAQQALDPCALSPALQHVETSVQEGHTLSSALEREKVFPPLVVRMVRMGEQTSTLGHNLLYVRNYVDTGLKQYVNHLVSLIEPGTILVMGLVMAGLCMLSLYPSTTR